MIEEQLAGRHPPPSQFGRALGELGVELIHAHSPQAKGRVERLFHTFQDRVVKELRLAGGAILEAANQFLEDSLPRYNQRFTVSPVQATDLHRPSPASRALDWMLCLKTKRIVWRDWTVAHNGQLYQVQTNIRATHVLVEERVKGTMRTTHQDRTLASHVIASRPVRAEAPPKPAEARRPVKPTAEHPWRKRLLPDRTRHAPAGMT